MGWPPFKLASILDSTKKGPHALKCCLTLSQLSHSYCCAVDEHGFQQAGAHHFALSLHASGPGCERQGWPFQHLYGTLHAAATNEGMLRNCSKLGLGVGNQHCCRHWSRCDGLWLLLCRACTRHAASATLLS